MSEGRFSTYTASLYKINHVKYDAEWYYSKQTGALY